MAKTTPKAPPILASYFPFLDGLRASMANLLEQATSSEFPALDFEPSDDRQVAEVLQQAKRWATRILEAHGQNATKELGYDHPEPKPVLVWFRGSAKQQGQGTTPRLDRAADVLGELPEEYSWTYATDTIMMCNRWKGRVQRPAAGREWITPSVENWDKIKNDLSGTRILTIVQAKRLVAWIRERIAALETALVPAIRRIRGLKRNRVLIEVTSAGAAREADISNAEAELLQGLAEKGECKSLRKTKQQLVNSVPELDLWITSKPRGRRSPGENEAMYQIDGVIRKAIQGPFAS